MLSEHDREWIQSQLWQLGRSINRRLYYMTQAEQDLAGAVSDEGSAIDAVDAELQALEDHISTIEANAANGVNPQAAAAAVQALKDQAANLRAAVDAAKGSDGSQAAPAPAPSDGTVTPDPAAAGGDTTTTPDPGLGANQSPGVGSDGSVAAPTGAPDVAPSA